MPDPDLPPPASPGRPSIAETSTQDPAAQLAWLDRETDKQLAAYRRRRRRDKRKAFALQLATVTLSATITVLLGVRTSGTTQQRLADIALALGAAVTVLAAAEAFFTHRGLWILRTTTVRDLETLVRHLHYYQTGLNGQTPDPDTIQCYLDELDAILTTDHIRWQHLRASAPPLAAAEEQPPDASRPPLGPPNPPAEQQPHGGL